MIRIGEVYYKIGMTNQINTVSNRLKAIKDEGYMSQNAKCIIDWKTNTYLKAAYLEGLFQAKYFSKKMTSPYRKNTSNGSRDLLDECYRLTDQDIDEIRHTLIEEQDEDLYNNDMIMDYESYINDMRTFKELIDKNDFSSLAHKFNSRHLVYELNSMLYGKYESHVMKIEEMLKNFYLTHRYK